MGWEQGKEMTISADRRDFIPIPEGFDGDDEEAGSTSGSDRFAQNAVQSVRLLKPHRPPRAVSVPLESETRSRSLHLSHFLRRTAAHFAGKCPGLPPVPWPDVPAWRQSNNERRPASQVALSLAIPRISDPPADRPRKPRSDWRIGLNSDDGGTMPTLRPNNVGWLCPRPSAAYFT